MFQVKTNPELGRMRMREAIANFTEWRKLQVKENTTHGYCLDLRHFCLYAHDPIIEEIELEDVLGWLNGMVHLGWEMNTLVRKSIALRKFFEYLRRRGAGVLDEQLIPVPDKTYRLPRVAKEETYRKLIDSIPAGTRDPRYARNAALIRMYWDTGARNSEILALDVGDLDLTNNRAIIKTAKSKGVRPFREIFWTAETNAHLVHWLRRREKLAKHRVFESPGAVFISISNWNVGHRLTTKGVGELLRRQAARAGVPYLNAHSLRHHKGHEIVAAGGSSADVMNILGHSSVQSGAIYTMMRGPELEERARKFMGAR